MGYGRRCNLREIVFQHRFDLSCLGNLDEQLVVYPALPVVALAEEPSDVYHEVYLEFHAEGLLEGPLDFVAV